MDANILTGQLFKDLVINGANNLKANYEIVNTLNVFPVPDGDTGTNMCMTIENGAKSIIDKNDDDISLVAKDLSKGMLLGARGNSGVILSQIFGGIYKGLENKKSVTAKELSKAYQEGIKQSYKAVKKPVEGTILTVFREATEYSSKMINDNSSITDFYKYHLLEAKASLARTKTILPELIEADVIDSGGAGYTYIVEGMLKCLSGEKLDSKVSLELSNNNLNDLKVFNADSVLTYGYCTEFILQLQNSKVNINTFKIEEITDYLETIGNSIVAIKDDDIVKVHVHTKDPGLVLLFGRKYGEFISIKIENMNLQNEEVEFAKKNKKHLKTALVVVSSGEGISNEFKKLGADYIVSGGQTMNPSTNDFINAFDSLDAENIIVMPNNGNIIMAANQACDIYEKANCFVVPTKSIAECYSALTMIDKENEDVSSLINELKEASSNVITGLVTFAIRDSLINNLRITKDDYIGICDDEIVADNKSKTLVVLDLLSKISDIKYKEVLTIIYGKDVRDEDIEFLKKEIHNIYPNLEIGILNGKQDIYSFILSIE